MNADSDIDRMYGPRAFESDQQIPDTITIAGAAEFATITTMAPHLATLPDGTTVHLPAGTVLMEATTEPTDPTPPDRFHCVCHIDPGKCAVVGHPPMIRRTTRVTAPASLTTTGREEQIDVRALTVQQAREYGDVDGPNASSWAVRYTEAMRVNALQRAEIERLTKREEPPPALDLDLSHRRA